MDIIDKLKMLPLLLMEKNHVKFMPHPVGKPEMKKELLASWQKKTAIKWQHLRMYIARYQE